MSLNAGSCPSAAVRYGSYVMAASTRFAIAAVPASAAEVGTLTMSSIVIPFCERA
jgi:hypothetical protein